MSTTIQCNINDLISKDGYVYQVTGFHLTLKEIKNNTLIENPTFSIPAEHLENYEIHNSTPSNNTYYIKPITSITDRIEIE